MTDIRFELPEINTWRLFHKSVTQQGVVDMVEAWEAHGYRFGAVCIDDGWTEDGRLGDWTPDPVRFPDLRGLVDWIHDKGYAARLWIAPAQIHPGTQIYSRAFPDHVLRDGQGRPCFYTGLGTYRLDPRSPIAATHIRDTMQRMVRDYGFDAFKVDFPPFYEPHDDFYKMARLHLGDDDARTMVSNFYKLVHDSVAAVNPTARICCAKDIQNCQPYIHDTICGDLVNCTRTDELVSATARRLTEYVRGHAVTPWIEMVWGGGGDIPVNNPDWHTGFIEFIAHSINFGLKIEHSFQPFDYPNAAQVRTLTNLYGPRHRRYKVLAAGRKVWSVEGLRNMGVALDRDCRFLVALSQDAKITLHTGELQTSALQWHCREVLGDRPIRVRGRNEYWPGTPKACRLEFEALAGNVYELWHTGPPVTFYNELYEIHARPAAALDRAGK